MTPVVAAYEYAVAGRAFAGERRSGDASLVLATPAGALVAVIDGLGHGDEAAVAANAAIEVLRDYAGEPLAELLQRCHERLQPTRGAALGLAILDVEQATLSWVGIGNVEAVLFATGHGPSRPRLCLTNRGGVVGYRLPAIDPRVTPINRGDLLILATDGIDESFVSRDIPRGAPQSLARSILERHGKTTDDALVLVLRWFGADASLRSA